MTKDTEKSVCLLLALSLLLATDRCSSLRMERVAVPPYKLKGEPAVLECHYRLEGAERLYTVKWYRDNEEFYRFVPKYKPPQISYRVEGVRIDHQQSNDTHVTLRAVTLKTSAEYRCEVSAEAPSFASAQGSGRLEVVVLPTNGPHITGEWGLGGGGEGTHLRAAAAGDTIHLTCTSGKSYPPAELRWLVNDVEVTHEESLVRSPPAAHSHGLATSSLGLRLRVAAAHFRAGALRLRCLASVSPVLWRGDRERSVLETPPLPTPPVVNREAMLLVRSGGQVLKSPVGLYILVTLLVLQIST